MLVVLNMTTNLSLRGDNRKVNSARNKNFSGRGLDKLM